MSHFYIPCFIPFSASAIPTPLFIFNVFSTCYINDMQCHKIDINYAMCTNYCISV